jgi:hypothetical protein
MRHHDTSAVLCSWSEGKEKLAGFGSVFLRTVSIFGLAGWAIRTAPMYV